MATSGYCVIQYFQSASSCALKASADDVGALTVQAAARAEMETMMRTMSTWRMRVMLSRMIGTTLAAIAPARGILLPALDRSIDDDWKKAVGKTKDA